MLSAPFPVMICAPAAARPAFRMGNMGRNGRERSEDGADDHIAPETRVGVCAGKREGTVSEWQAGDWRREIQRRF